MTKKVYILTETDTTYFMYPNPEPDSSLQQQLFAFVIDKNALIIGEKIIGEVRCYTEKCPVFLQKQPIYKNSVLYPHIMKAIKNKMI